FASINSLMGFFYGFYAQFLCITSVHNQPILTPTSPAKQRSQPICSTTANALVQCNDAFN
ncbi:hypothetical protein PEC18_35375, partial [Paucibacter sp. O1-1]|nr:hypothetical protein [Paucibacter sp. O1-1]MDA3830948.1 hypothetical protein [Paucibacter sp. O1-1]